MGGWGAGGAVPISRLCQRVGRMLGGASGRCTPRFGPVRHHPQRLGNWVADTTAARDGNGGTVPDAASDGDRAWVGRPRRRSKGSPPKTLARRRRDPVWAAQRAGSTRKGTGRAPSELKRLPSVWHAGSTAGGEDGSGRPGTRWSPACRRRRRWEIATRGWNRPGNQQNAAPKGMGAPQGVRRACGGWGGETPEPSPTRTSSTTRARCDGAHQHADGAPAVTGGSEAPSLGYVPRIVPRIEDGEDTPCVRTRSSVMRRVRKWA